MLTLSFKVTVIGYVPFINLEVLFTSSVKVLTLTVDDKKIGNFSKLKSITFFSRSVATGEVYTEFIDVTLNGANTASENMGWKFIGDVETDTLEAPP